MEIDERKESDISGFGRPGLVTGVLIAAMLTASLIAFFYLAWRVAGFPFVPFDVFGWMTRILPGQVLAAGIGAMVTVIRALNSSGFETVRGVPRKTPKGPHSVRKPRIRSGHRPGENVRADLDGYPISSTLARLIGNG